MTAGIHSPDVNNYMIGKGFVIFKPDGESAYFHVGNVPSLSLQPNVEKKDHFSSMEGTKSKDLTIVLSKSGTFKIVMEEQTARNLAILFLGTVSEASYGLGTGTTVDLFARSSYTGAVRFYGTNDVGPRWFLDLPKVTFNPSGAWDPIGEDFAKLEVTGDWEAVSGDWGTLTLLAAAGTLPPENIVLPTISGLPQVGETLTAYNGGWTGASSYSYLWKANGGAAAATATNKTYVPAAGDIGKVMTVVVTASNDAGSTPATSPATVAVEA